MVGIIKNKDVLAIFFLFALSVAVLSFHSPKTLNVDSYALAIQVEQAVEKGDASNPAIQFASSIVKATGELEQTLVFLPVLLGAISILSLYFISRSFFDERVSLAASLVLLFLPPFSHFFAAGFFTAEAFSLCALAVLAAVFAFFETRFLQALRPYSQLFLPLLLIVFSLNARNFESALAPASDYSLLLAFSIAASAVLIKHFHSREKLSSEVAYLSTFVASLLLSFYYVPLAAFGFAFCSAFGFKELSKHKQEFKATFILFCLVSFSVSLLLLSSIIDSARSGLFSLFVTASAGGILYLYKEQNVSQIAKYSAIAFVFSALFFTTLYSTQQAVKQLDEDFSNALAWVKENTLPNSAVAGINSGPAIAFVSKRQGVQANAELAAFFLSNASASTLKSKGVDYIIVDSRLFDDVSQAQQYFNSSKAKFEAFAPTSQFFSYNGAPHAYFTSRNSYMLVPVTEQTGELLKTNAVIQDVGSVSFGKLLFLNNSNSSLGMTFQDRLVYPKSGFESNLFKLFFPNQFEQAEGVEEVYKSNYVRVFKLN
ncbi:hypothetical protein HY992_06125 [Candidatus Micrarchaeota archaeon]|nr:hypothetical protein [Candidatus Micrarchaeota archaeon]